MTGIPLKNNCLPRFCQGLKDTQKFGGKGKHYVIENGGVSIEKEIPVEIWLVNTYPTKKTSSLS